MAEKKSIAERVREIADPVAEQLGLSVWDVFYGKEGQNMIMRITIDKPEGIGIQDCESMSRAVDPLIDEANLTSAPYSFEVSSPGLGRRIRTDEQFIVWNGRPVAVKLIREDAQGKKEIHTLNLKDVNIISSPYYYLQQNDIVYVEPNKVKARNSAVGQTTSLWFSGTSILVSLTSLLYNILK